MFFLSKVLDPLVSPLVWVVALLITALVLVRRRPRLARGLSLSGIVLLWFFSTGWVASRLWQAGELDAVSTYREGQVYDVVVVLGGLIDDRATLRWGAPAYNENVERLLVPYELLRAGKARKVLVSGGIGHFGEGTSEAVLLARQLETWGIEKERILVEPGSRNTRENAVQSKALLDEHAKGASVLLVTSAFHMTRAAGCFRKAGVVFDTLPVDYRSRKLVMFGGLDPRAQSLALSEAAIHERVGRIVYRLRGWTDLSSTCAVGWR